MRTSSECNISLKFQNRLINEWIFDYYCKIANNTVQYIADAFLILFFFSLFQPVEDLMLSSIHAFSVELRLASESVLGKVKYVTASMALF